MTYDPIDTGPNDSDADRAVTLGEADITNETLVRAKTDATVSTIAGGTFTSPSWGTVPKDERNEFSSDQFTPDESGWYWVSFWARIESSADGDRLQARVQNVTDSSEVLRTEVLRIGSAGQNITPPLTMPLDLTAAKAYEFQVRNIDSQFDIGAANGELGIRSAFR